MFKIKCLKFQNKGVTLVEIMVVVFIIAIFSAILISNFPKILRQFALSRSVYKLAQDLRKTEDLGLSGVRVDSEQGAVDASGYGIYINLGDDNGKYIIYADINNSQTFDNSMSAENCEDYDPVEDDGDCIVEAIHIGDDNPDLIIKELRNITGDSTSINFEPPNPTTKIEGLCTDCTEVGIVIGLNSDSSMSRTVLVNTAGLIQVK
ncbi:MAG: prepilin-type N-terminal cleavage/methylation domain-containing protein [Candidatus Staskawiczbacteria bacterium]|nr:prepilin-type N-terminal cleavage/methylation domain-containing protein [Candidatus Staskawiczbacteria bacterium]